MASPRLLLTVSLAAVLGVLESAPARQATVVEIENDVQTTPAGQAAWSPAKRGQSLGIGERIRTRHRSRATVHLSEKFGLRMNQFTTIEIVPDLVNSERPRLDLKAGASFLFSREEDGEMDLTTPTANAALRGTQLWIEVTNGRTAMQVLEGEVELSNPHGRLLLAAGEAGEAVPGQPPRRTAVIEARNLLQWALYYPAVIDPAEFGLGAAERQALADSFAAYRSGDLLGALEAHPEGRTDTAAGRLYHAAVLMAVGRVDQAREAWRRLPVDSPGRRALERMQAAVLFREMPSLEDPPATASEALAESYYLQSRSQLEAAREAARLAARLSPENGYAWTRVAELEFSFGRLDAAGEALDRALHLTPRNARTHALRGFVLAGENDLDAAREAFETAVELDGALGSGWLGLGLVKIRQGDSAGGIPDLQTAAIVEPTVSIYHSYLGKAFSQDGYAAGARKDFDLARQLDPDDPTPWLYSALDLQQSNQPNAAIADLERSIELNDNRRVYRSRFLLDQDRAVRSSNLARIYQNNGMFDLAVREATRAVESDYTNASAHLFLSNSFDALRDPSRIELRYETPWFNELLLANLLSPVGGGPLSQFVSQQEYSKLLAEEGLGGSLTTEWRSDSEYRAAASLFGHYGNFSFGIDAYRREDDGDRFNSASRLDEIYAQMKWQPTPDNTFYLLGKWARQSAGDIFRTRDNQPLEPWLGFDESQDPGLLLAGWNHRWKPGVHTLLLAGRLAASQSLTNPRSRQILVERDADGLRPGFINDRNQFTNPALRDAVPPAIMLGPDFDTLVYSDALLANIAPFIGRGDVLGVTSAPFSFGTSREFEIYSAEIQHIIQRENNTLIFGGRWQTGEIHTRSRLVIDRPAFGYGGFPTPAASQSSSTDIDRLSGYIYDYWSPLPDLTLIGGLSWDHIDHPVNFRNPPVSDLQRDEQGFSAKAGVSWTPSRSFALRGAYTEGLGGVTFDESVRLEPTQIAGFNQAFRTVISESLAGSVEAPEFRTYGLMLDGRIGDRTWWGLRWQAIEQEGDRTLGAFTGYDTGAGVLMNEPAFFPGGIRQRLDYRENGILITLNHLLGSEFAIGADYRLTRSELETCYPDLIAAGPGLPSQLAPHVRDRATLHRLSLHADWNSPSGWFARAEANWFHQNLDDDPRGRAAGTTAFPDDTLLQFNAFAGYRFHRNLCEVSAGVLNIGDQDYRLSPLTPYSDLARERTFVLRCRLAF